MPSPSVPFPLIPDQPDVEFRFTIKTARELERATRNMGGLAGLHLRGSNVEAVVVTTFYAMRWNKPKLTEDKVVDLIQDYIDHGGDVVVLINTLTKALNESGVYGKPTHDTDTEDDAADPLASTTTETPTM